MSAREVTLVGGSPWGFRMHGGHDLHQPLRISRVNPGSKAAQQGVREGDLISSINDRNTRDLTNGEAHALLRNAGDHLKLGLNQETVGSPKRRIYRSSLQENTSIETLKKITTKTTTTSSTQIVSAEANKVNGTDDTRREHVTFASLNGGLKNSLSATERSNTDGETKRSTDRKIVPTSGYITEDSEDHRQSLRMPRASRGRKNRRNRNNKRVNNYQQRDDRQGKPASTSDDRTDDNSDLESVASGKGVAKISESIVEHEVRDEDTDNDLEIARNPTKLTVDRLKNENTQDNCEENVKSRRDESDSGKKLEVADSIAKIAEKGPTEGLIEAKVNGHAVKVTTEESTIHVDEASNAGRLVSGEFLGRHGIGSIRGKRGPQLISSSAAAAARRRLKVERRAMNTETNIVEITSVSGSLPLAASIGHVPGVGILETGMTGNDEADGTIVTVSEPLEPVQPLPSAVASKVEGLMFGKREFNALTLLARATRDNNNNNDDENERSDGPEIREVSDSDAETDNSSNSRPTTGATFVVEAESDVERDSTLDQRYHGSIAEETEDDEDDNFTKSEDYAVLENIEIPEDICGTSKLNRCVLEGKCETVEKGKVSGRNGNLKNIGTAKEICGPVELSVKAVENQSEEVKEVTKSRNPGILEKIPGEVHDPIELNIKVIERKSEEVQGVPQSLDTGMPEEVSQQFCDPVERNRGVDERKGEEAGKVEKVKKSRDVDILEKSDEICGSVELNVGVSEIKKEEKIVKEVGDSIDVCTHPEDSLAVFSRETFDPVKSDVRKVVVKQEYDGEVAHRVEEEEEDEKDEDDKYLGERSSSIEDDSLAEKFDRVVKVNEEIILREEKCVTLDGLPPIIERKKPDVTEETKAAKSPRDMNVLKEILLSETTGASKSSNELKARVIPVEVEKSLEPTESLVTKEVENKLRLFIEGLELPTLTEDPQIIDHRGFEIERETCGNSSQRKVKKRAILESYYTEAKHADRFLDIIQEEGDKLSEGGEQHIRDFINEEIGKYRREKRDAQDRLELRETDEKTREESSKLAKVPEEDFTSDKESSRSDNDKTNEINVVRLHKTMENTHETEESTTETHIVVTKIWSNEENRAISEMKENKYTMQESNEKSCSKIKLSENGISDGISKENGHVNICGAEPPTPPKRFSSFVSDSETLQPPTPPDIDYPIDLPEIPALPAETLLTLQHPPVPPRRKRKPRRSNNESPKRPPLPSDLFDLNDRIMDERIYENVEYTRNIANTSVDQVPPPLPPLPRNLQAFVKGNSVYEDPFEIPISFDNFANRISQYYRENDQSNLVNVNSRMASSSETSHREHRRENHRLRNFRPVDEATIGGFIAGNDACLEIASSVGNHRVYDENAAAMPLGAPPSSRKIAQPNFGHSGLARRQPELSHELSRSNEWCVSKSDIIGKNKQKSDKVDGDKVETENSREKFAKFRELSDVNLKNHQAENCKVEAGNTQRSENSQPRGKERILPVEKSWEASELKNEKNFESKHYEKIECHREYIDEKISNVSEERTKTKREYAFGDSSQPNFASSITEGTKKSIDDSRITLLETKPGSQVCVENNQAESPTRPPRRQQHSSSYSSASSSSQLLGNRSVEACSSQGQTNSVTTARNKNSVDDETRTLPTLIVTKTLEKETNLIFRSPSPDRNEIADDRESSSSGAATPNTVRLNPSNSFTDLASLEVREELEKSDEENQSSETKLTNLRISSNEKNITNESLESHEEHNLYYVPLQDQSCSSVAGEFKISEDARPDLLKDLCIRKILSLPYGLQIINEITLPKFNIFKNIQTIQEGVSGFVDKCPEKLLSDGVNVDSDRDTSSLEEMKKQRPKTWMGVPTVEDPKLLVCLSPSQQESQVRTSIDNLLDLHKKFLNRRSYHEDHRDEVDVPKYWVELGMEMKTNGRIDDPCQGLERQPQESRSSGLGNRLLEIIKENPIASTKQSSCVAAAPSGSVQNDDELNYEMNKIANSRDIRQDRLRATRLSDWLSLARRDPQDYSVNPEETAEPSAKTQEGIGSESDRCSRTSSRATRGSPVPTGSEAGNPANATNTRDNVVRNNECLSPEDKWCQGRLPLVNDLVTIRTTVDNSYEKIYDQVITEMEHKSQQIGKRFGEPMARENRINSALIVKSTPALPMEQQTPPISAHQYDKYPISLNSAIIDKSNIGNDESSRKRTPPMSWTRGTIDPRHNVNPALIDARSDNREDNETIKSTRPIIVDRSCIDTTSIFDKTPPRCHLAPRKYQDPEALKHDTATDIIENLKRLQSNTKLQQGLNIDGRRRYSLPQECFDRQLEYIEQLENQLREVILAEEEERKAYEDFQGHVDRDARQRVRSMIDLSDNRNTFEGDSFVGNKKDSKSENWKSNCGNAKVTLDNDVPDNQRESWHEESRTREGDCSEFSKREGHREATKSVTDQGDLRVENSTTSYKNVEEKHVNSVSGKSNGVSSETSPEWKTLFGKNITEEKFLDERGFEETAECFATTTSSNVKFERPWNSTCPLKASKPSGTLPPNGEVFRRKMFDEYVHKVHEREERKQHKVIKISSHTDNARENSSSFPKSPPVDTGMSKMEREFIERARNRMSRFGIKLDESSESEVPTDNDNDNAKTSCEKDLADNSPTRSGVKKNEENGDCEAAKCLIDGHEIRDAKCLPKHLQEFLELATSNDALGDARGKTNATDLLHEIDTALRIGKGFLLGEGVWSPGSEPPPPPKQPSPERGKNTEKDAGIPPVWTPSSAGTSPVAERKEFRPVAFESPVLSRKKFSSQVSSGEAPPPWKNEDIKRDASQTVTHNITTRIVNSHSAPSQGLNTLAGAPRLPRAQNPTITLLQKAREGQLPKGAAYLEDSEPSGSRTKIHTGPRVDPAEIIHTVKREYESEPETEKDRRKKMTDLGPRKIEGIGPMTKDGMPVALRSEVKDNNQARWYKKMYDSLHRADKDDDYITVRYKPRRGARYGYGSASGYLSEPEPRGYSERSTTLDTRRRQRNKENDFCTSTMPRKATPLNSQAEVFRNQPGRIENYEPGRSSIGDKETKEWWDEVMDIFDGWLDDNGHVRGDRRVDNDGLVIEPLRMSHQASRVLSLSYRPDSSESVSLLSPLTTSRPAKSPESTSSTIVQRSINVERPTTDASSARAHKLVTDRPSTSTLPIATLNAPKLSRTNPVPASLILDRSTKSIITSTMEHSRYTLANLPIKLDRRIHSMTYNGRNSRKDTVNSNCASIISRENVTAITTPSRAGNEEDRIIRPLAHPEHHSRHPIMLEGKSKSFVLPDRGSTLVQRMLGPSTGSQSNLTKIGITLKERSSLVATSITHNDDQQYDEHHHFHHHHRHHHHHHHHHQRQRRLPTSNSTSTSTSSSSCTSSTNHNITLLPSSLPTLANNITTKNPQNATSSRPFDQRNPHTAKPYMSHALKESGYESDSTLIFRRRDDASPLSPLEQRLAYKTIQKGGDVPLHGLRKPAPERPKDDTEIEYFPISPTLTRIRVRRRGTVVTRADATSMSSSSSSMTFARYKRTAPSAPTNSTILPIGRITATRNGARSVSGRTSSTISTTRTTTTTTRTNSPPPGRPPTRVTSPRPPSPPRRRSSRHNATLKTFCVNNKTIERSSSCPDRSRVCLANRRHEQCFAAESASNIRFLRERLSSKLSEQVRDRETSRKSFGNVRTASTCPALIPKTRSAASSKSVQPELPKRRSEPCLAKRIPENSVSPARGNVVPSTRTIASCRQVSKSASPIWRSSREQQQQEKSIGDTRGPSEEKPPLGRSSSKSPSFVGSRGTGINGLVATERTSRQNGRSKLSSTAGLRTDQVKARRTRKESNESLKKLCSSSTEVASPLELKKGHSKQRERDFGLRSPIPSSGVVQKITTSSGNTRQKSVEAKSAKITSASISKSQPSTRTSLKNASTSSRRNLTSSTSSAPRLTPCESSRSSVIGRAKNKKSTIVDFDTSTSGSSIVAASDSNARKRSREKPQTIVKQPAKRPVTIEVNPQERKPEVSKRSSVGRESRREPSRSKRVTSDNDSDKRKSKKSPPMETSSSRDKQPKNMMKKKPETPALTMERIKKHQQATRTDTFFQNLFLRNLPSPVPSQSSTVRRSSVMERAKMFQECATDHFKSEPSLRSLGVYLAHKRPVSNSRFKNWERESLSSRSSSPYGISWPGRSIFRKVSKFDSLLGMDEFGSSASLCGRSPSPMTRECLKERSLSEPPLKVICSPDTRDAGRVSSPLARTASPSPTRSAACRRIKSLKQHDRQEVYPLKTRTRSAGEAEDSERRRPNLGSNLSLTKSTGSLESPSLNRDDYQRYLLETIHVRRKSERYKDLHDFYASLERMGELERTTSASDLRPRLKDEEIIDYDRWKEIRSKERAEQELKAIYGKLKNVQRDKDFLFSTKDIDKYRWRGDCGLRCKERSVENIRESFRRLENEESELESTRRREIASKKDVYKPLWRGNSVANVASNITKRAANKDEENERSLVQPTLQKHLGGSKKFWSSLSIEQVTTLKNQLNEIYGTDVSGKPKVSRSPEKFEMEGTAVVQDEPVKNSRQREIIPKTCSVMNKYEIVVPPEEEFGDGTEDLKGLHVRCHSMLTPLAATKNEESSSEVPLAGHSPIFKRRGSIGNGRSLETPKTERPVPVPPPLSEVEKKRLSLTLGKEILDKVTRRRASTTPVTPRETRGAIAVASVNPKSTSSSVPTSVTNTSPRTCYSLETSFDDENSPRTHEKSDFLLVLTPNDDSPTNKRRVENVLDEWSQKPPLLAMALPAENSTKIAITSGSEFDSATESSGTSVRTVVRRGSEAEVVPRKVEFFEKIERTGKSTDDKTPDQRSERSSCYVLPEVKADKTKKNTICKLSSAQSFADLKELFGEVESARYTTLPFRGIGRTRSTSPDSDRPADGSGSGRGGRSTSVSPDVTHERAASTWRSLSSSSQSRDMDRARSVSPCPVSDSTCSLESSRNRSVSPDPERYWRAYLNLVKNGSVKKLRAKFESLEELTGGRTKFVPAPKRFRSDPELTRNLLKRVTDERKTRLKAQEVTDVAWLRRKYEPTTRGRARKRAARSPPIPRIPLRLEDLSMPRINIISKTAELKDNLVRSGSTDSLARRAETEELEANRPVGRIREKFERFDGKCSTDGKPSLLGEMFTSAPNVHELRDIAPYLAGRWVAHKYPSRRDNARSLSLPPDLENSGLDASKKIEVVKPRTGRTNVPAKNGERKRIRENRGLSTSSSSSPVRPRTPTSILKQPQVDPFANQPFDPSKHRPRYRYQPPPPPPPPPVPIFRRDTRAWWPPIPTYTAKPSVTFEGPISFGL